MQEHTADAAQLIPNEDYIFTSDGKRVKLAVYVPDTANDQDRIFHKVREHFGCDPSLFPIVKTAIESYDLPNVSRALDKFLEKEQCSAKIIGLDPEGSRICLLRILKDPKQALPLSEGPIQYTYFELPDNQKLACVSQGLYLISDGERRLVCLVTESMVGDIQMEVAAPTREIADEFIGTINKLKPIVNIYREKVVSVSGSDRSGIHVNFHKLPNLTRDSLILPAGVLERLEMHTVTFAQKSKSLLKAGRHLKRGILMHGEPGTGKTLTAMYLVTAMKGRTTFLLAGAEIRHLALVCNMARELQPSTVILEDVDLIAEERSSNRFNSMLFELLNAMDGLAQDTDILFILTTNRPEILEKALAQRPGRVDLAVKISLPDEACRLKLFELYSQGLELSVPDFRPFVKRTKGASAAFIRELVRRAALFADEVDGRLCVKEKHFVAALEELSANGSSLTQSLLGFSAGGTI